ncbi:hypothetical protein ACROYT_G010442 [Oculina patagonica]
MVVAGIITQPEVKIYADAQFARIRITGCADCLNTTAPSQEEMGSLFDITASKHVDGVTGLLCTESTRHQMLYSLQEQQLFQLFIDNSSL